MKKIWQDMVTLGLGFWLIVSPLILPRTLGDHVLFNNSLIVGVFITLVAVAAILRPIALQAWILMALGSWLVAASYFLGYEEFFNRPLTALAENQLIVGVLVVIDAAFYLFRRKAISDIDKPWRFTSTK